MPTNEKKGITVKIDAGLHAEVRQFLDSHGMTMAEFVTLALQDELHPKFNQEDKNMGNMRTIAFQVPEELFQKIKDYLQRNNMTQKEFMLGLIENEIKRDLAQRAAETPENTEDYDEQEEAEEECEEQDNDDFSEDSDGESDQIDEDEEFDEDEEQGMSMGM